MTGLIASLLLGLWCAELTTSQRCYERDRVRLNDVSSYFGEDRAGRVEICDCISSNFGCWWATITVPTGMTSWGWKNAQVACRELYPEDYGVINPILQDTVPDRVSSSQYVFPRVIDCDGTEAIIANCSWALSIVTSHARDAYIWCRSSAPIQGDVRLSGSSVSNLNGVVEIYEGSSVGWVTVCNDFWDLGDANVACKQLGYESGTPKSFDSNNFAGPWFGNLSEFFISCTGSEEYLGDCSFIRMAGCMESSLRGGVTCVASGLPEGSVRLNPPDDVDTNFNRRPEVLYNGRWGSICDAGWDLRDGDVVCQSLGLDSASIDTFPSFSSPGVGRAIWLSSLVCDGTEVDLTLCIRTYPVGYNPSCTNDDAAALECDGGSGGLSAGGLSAGEIASIVIGLLFVLIFVIVFVIMCCKMNFLQSCECSCDCDCSVTDLCSCPSPSRRRSTRRPAPGRTANISLVGMTRQRSESSSSANSDGGFAEQGGDFAEQGGDFAEQGHSSLPEPLQDTDLRRGAPPSYFDAVRLDTAVPVATPDPPQYTADEQLGNPESSLPSYPVSTSHFSPSLPANTELSPPQMSNTAASASHPQGASNTGEVHTISEVVSSHPMPADINIPTSAFQPALGDDEPPPYPPEVSSHSD